MLSQIRASYFVFEKNSTLLKKAALTGLLFFAPCIQIKFYELSENHSLCCSCTLIKVVRLVSSFR